LPGAGVWWGFRGYLPSGISSFVLTIIYIYLENKQLDTWHNPVLPRLLWSFRNSKVAEEAKKNIEASIKKMVSISSMYGLLTSSHMSPANHSPIEPPECLAWTSSSETLA
jgi:hypothetical protein